MTNLYLEHMVETATPNRLITLLFERGMVLMEEAEQAFQAQEREMAHEALVKAQRVVAELIGSLDLERGGYVAFSLHRLYNFVWERLLQANLRKSPEPLQDAKQVWTELREIWRVVEERIG